MGLRGGWRILHALISSQNIITEVKAGNVRWAGHVAGRERKDLLGGKT